MANYIYQYMIHPRVKGYLERKQKEYRHKTLSQTLNYILNQNLMLEQMGNDETTEEKPKEKGNEFVGDKILREIMNKNKKQVKQ